MAGPTLQDEIPYDFLKFSRGETRCLAALDRRFARRHASDMTKLIFSIMTSLDGYYEGPNGELDWHYADDEHNEIAAQLLGSAEALLFGRKTYEGFAAYWPSEDARQWKIFDQINDIPKIVFSHTLKKAEWKNSRIVSEGSFDEIERLKKQARKNLVILGSPTLAAGLARRGQIDEFQFQIAPILLGKGNSVFRGIEAELRLKLLSMKSRESGMIDATYVAGPERGG
jgi:dihydrofolate reductase